MRAGHEEGGDRRRRGPLKRPARAPLTSRPGDCARQPPGIVHNEIECCDDIAPLEILSPAAHETVVIDTIPKAAAAR